MDWELVFWLVALVVSVAVMLRALAEPQDLYYEGRLDKIGGKGGRQSSPVRPGIMIHTGLCTPRGLPGRHILRALSHYTHYNTSGAICQWVK